ncbi:MAG: hypothetical protein A2W91_11020 [Bacteroidetes bacterium GWF2_38_335]|nr:MAG: hypothetical protein A2W91_11020 [Bacteroidetes bacterium GWF2_38_335]OFY81767.1 MAG: hypothetical protein A2281_06020 [Bacteroidetes bacterium RIFOXYA12_FULL_38_20]
MKNFFLFLFLSVVSLINAQNYTAVNPDSTYFFHPQSKTELLSCYNESYHNFIRCIHIDSVVSGSETTLFSIPEVHNYDYSWDNFGCFNDSCDSWCGKKIIIKDNGDNLFITRNSDSVIIKTLAGMGEEWKLFVFENGDYINAEIVNWDTLTLYGQTDSVKYIELQVFDSSDNPITSDLNNQHIVLSKNYGLIEMFNFREFSESDSHYPIVKYKQIAVSSGVNDLLLVKDVYDFNIGDEFHKIFSFGNHYFSQYEVKKVINKYYSITNDTVFYDFDYNLWGNNDIGPGTYFHTIDTITKYYTNLDSIIHYGQNIRNFLPLESIITSGGGSSYLMNYIVFTDSLEYNGRMLLCNLGQEFRKFDEDTCFNTPYFDSGAWVYEKYVKGCGDIYNNFDVEMYTNCMPCSDLVYFLKGSEEWGNPLTIPNSIEENIKPEIIVSVFPNPATTEINLSVDQLSLVEIYDVLMNKKMESTSHKIVISNLPVGVYYVRVTTENGIAIGKFIKL